MITQAPSPISSFRLIQDRLPNLKAEAASHLRSNVSGLLAANIRKYKFQAITNFAGENALGLFANPRPASGKVVDVSDEWTIIKEGRSLFHVIHNSVLREPLPIGSNATVTPYRLRHFNGAVLGEPVESETRDGFRTKTMMIGESTSPLPVAKPNSHYLIEMIDQFERLPAGDPEKMRRVSHILVDAGATDFEVVDPTDGDSRPPSIACRVKTKKLVGRVEIALDLGADYYRITATPDNGEPKVREYIDFTSVGATLIDLIDDGEWRYATVELLPAKMKRAA